MGAGSLQDFGLLLALCGIPIVLWVLLANAVGNVAQRKGLSHAAFFFFALLFSPLIGWVLAEIASPRVAPIPPTADSKKCPDCAELVKSDARKCRFCGKDFSSAVAPAGSTEEARAQNIAPSQFGRLGTAPMDAGYEVGARSNSTFGWVAGIVAALLIGAILYMTTFR